MVEIIMSHNDRYYVWKPSYTWGLNKTSATVVWSPYYVFYHLIFRTDW